MPAMRPFPGRRLRPFGVSLLAVLLLLGALDFHPADEAHGGWGPGGGQVYFPTAAHPDLPLHWEQAHPAERPHCDACLHRLQSQGLHPQAPVSIAPPSSRDVARPASGPAALRVSLRPSGARAPPLS
jgi:hypothetical protein